MTHPVIRNHLTALAVLLQVFAAFGTTRGLVLCVGPEGHVAVEDAEASSHCRAAQSAFGSAEQARERLEVAVPPKCTDTPVFAAAPDRWVPPFRFATPVLAVAPIVSVSRPALAISHERIWAQPPRERARILRSIVLLI
jgi:hypothetical protein